MNKEPKSNSESQGWRRYLPQTLIGLGLAAAIGIGSNFDSIKAWFAGLTKTNQPQTEQPINRFAGLDPIQVTQLMEGCSFALVRLQPDMKELIANYRPGYAVVGDRFNYSEATSTLRDGTPLTEKMDQTGSLIVKGAMAEVIGQDRVSQQILTTSSELPIIRHTAPALELEDFFLTILAGRQTPQLKAELLFPPAGSDLLDGFFLESQGDGNHIAGGIVSYYGVQIGQAPKSSRDDCGNFTHQEVFTAAKTTNFVLTTTP
jgi:hypothetical protein